MDFAVIIDGVESFAAYIGELPSVIGHVGRVAPLHDYCAGLLASEGRRSVEPMAALTAPAEVSVQHQRLLHFVGEADWSDARVLMKVRLPGDGDAVDRQSSRQSPDRPSTVSAEGLGH
jgi:SRSO17 transposase